jgi:hypothetical protein
MMPPSTPVRVAIGALLLLVPAFLACTAIPRLVFGLRSEAAHRLVQAALVGQKVSGESARAAAAAFEQAPQGDGDDKAQVAEFLALAAGGNPAMYLHARQEVTEALAHSPANARAWTLVCEIDATIAPARAVACLDTDFAIARYDWFTAGRRMRLVAYEWPFLDETLRDSAASLIIPMWNTAQWANGLTLRDALYELSRTDDGRQLLRAGLIPDREALRSFNRFVIRERTDGH